MKFITCESPGQFSLKEKEMPQPLPGHSLVQVRRVGICGTDLHAFQGNQAFFSYPRILGHELAAEIIESDHGFVAGDRVAILPYIDCEVCSACKSGKSNCCTSLKVFGVHTDGGMQDAISFPTRLLIKANDLSLDQIALIEPLAIGAHALRRAQIKKGDVITVIGCGPIGIGIIQLGSYLGAKVIAMDVNDRRLDVAKANFGAHYIMNPKNSSADDVRRITGDLAGVVFDASGNRTAIEGAVSYMRHGGSLVLVGLTKSDLTFHHPSIHAKETTLLCSRNATREDFEFVMKVLRENKFNHADYVTRRVDRSAIMTDFESWTDAASKDIKIMTCWD